MDMDLRLEGGAGRAGQPSQASSFPLPCLHCFGGRAGCTPHTGRLNFLRGSSPFALPFCPFATFTEEEGRDHCNTSLPPSCPSAATPGTCPCLVPQPLPTSPLCHPLLPCLVLPAPFEFLGLPATWDLVASLGLHLPHPMPFPGLPYPLGFTPPFLCLTLQFVPCETCLPL